MEQPLQGGPHQALGLPPTAMPTPMQWTIARSQIVGPQGTAQVHVVCVDTAVGRVALWFSPEDLRKFCDSILESLTGLVIAQPGANGNPA